MNMKRQELDSALRIIMHMRCLEQSAMQNVSIMIRRETGIRL